MAALKGLTPLQQRVYAEDSSLEKFVAVKRETVGLVTGVGEKMEITEKERQAMAAEVMKENGASGMEERGDVKIVIVVTMMLERHLRFLL